MAREKEIIDLNVDIVREGKKIVLPDGMATIRGARALMRLAEQEEENAETVETFPVSPYEGAYALARAIGEICGFATAGRKVQTMFGEMGGAKTVKIEVSLGETVDVPWGEFDIPTLDNAKVETSGRMDGGRALFTVTINAKGKHQDAVNAILQRARELATTESIYKGKAFEIIFTDENGEPHAIPKVKFIRFSEEKPIFSKEIEDQIAELIYTPIVYSDQTIAAGESLKRGVLLAGEYGTGKTLLASDVGRVSIDNAWTYIYVQQPEELVQTLVFARQFGRVVVFCEDVERIAGQDRTDECQNVLNTIDGIDAKETQIVTILTTNHPTRVHEAMHRPGRIDLTLAVNPPDAEAVERHIRTSAGDQISRREDLSQPAKLMAGMIPASIKEIVKRAKLSAIWRSNGKGGVKITAGDIEKNVGSFQREREVLAGGEQDTRSNTAKELGEGIGSAIIQVAEKVKNGHDTDTEVNV